MALDKSFDPKAVETRWYSQWESAGWFAAKGSGEPYCIQLPPPNVTGTLHMGHAFQQTLMDALIRYHRMLGHDANWVAGTDHAGIATQIVVERQLEAEGTSRQALGRERFIERVWRWKEESGSAITRQMRRLGASCDWGRERFTMDEGLSAVVTEVFVRLHEQGLIYRGKRLVNWDPVLKSAVSDLEVESEEETGSLWHIRYPLASGADFLVVATTRPETMLGDVAVAVHPDDPRYQALIGRQLRHPLVDRTFPIIADAILVDPKFGTGAVKVTPAHDFNDFETGKRHGLPEIVILELDGRVNANGGRFAGLDRFEARKAVKAAIAELGLERGTKPHTLALGRCQRCDSVAEPMISTQWFVRAAPLAEPAMAAVRDGRTQIVPEDYTIPALARAIVTHFEPARS